ncbi:MAG: hypothetical protein NC086_02950 [Alistipes sp.]|nr:hypothetical protein [Alistipes sp.]
MSRFIKSENGHVIVEATILMPFCIITVIAMYYASIFLCQKAILQTNLENALVYYKNVESDTFVEAKANMEFAMTDDTVSAVGSSFSNDLNYLFPYRFFMMQTKNDEVEQFIRSMCKNMFFDDKNGSSVQIEVKTGNYIVYKTISATVTQTVAPAISLSNVGLPNELLIEVSGMAVVSDGDEMIRNVDFVIDITQDTKLGKKAAEIVEKGVEFYNKFKSAIIPDT